MTERTAGERAEADTEVPRVEAEHPTRQPLADARGTLVLMGGNCTVAGRALGSFLDITAARQGGCIVGLTTASGFPARSARYWRKMFREAGATNVDIPTFRREDHRTDLRIASLIDSASGVFLAGGDQVTLVAALSGTRTERAIHDLYRRGGAIGGTSAGAAALSELTMAGGEVDAEGKLVEQYIGPGLGLLGYDAIVDTHFSQRRRLQRLFFVIAGNRQLLGLGIDEDTALVVRGEIGEVLGAGGVTFVDGRDTVRYDNIRELEAGRQLTLTHLRVGIVGTHHHINLRARELQELIESPNIPND